MLQSVTIKNFQCHLESHLDFSVGVNAIIGQSDSGKSAILRAISWVLTNKPSGTGFINMLSDGDCVVKLTFTDGTTIERARGTTTNYYKLNDTETFTAIGQGVPEPIQRVINMNEVNILGQLDRVFLLSDSPGQIAQRLNEVSALSIIDVVQKQAASDLRSTNAALQQCQNEIADIGKARQSLSFLPELSSALEQAKAQAVNVAKYHADVDALSAALIGVQDVERILERFTPIPSVSDCEKLFVLHTQYVDAKRDADGLFADIKQCQGAEAALAKLPSHPSDNDLALLTSSLSAITGLRAGAKRFTDVIKDVEQASTALAYSEAQHQSALTLLNDSVPDICPLCGASGGSYAD